MINFAKKKKKDREIGRVKKFFKGYEPFSFERKEFLLEAAN